MFVAALAAAAERLLWLVARPALITGLTADGGRILIASVLDEGQRPIAALNPQSVDFFVIAPLALSLAAPVRPGGRRGALAVLALVCGGLWSVAVVMVESQSVLRTHAGASLGMALFSEGAARRLALLNAILVEAGMILLPGAFFVAGTTWSLRSSPIDSRRALRRALVAALAAVVPVAGAAAAARRPGRPDALAAWESILALNPGSVPALVNVGVRREEEGRPDEAIVLLRRATALDPGRGAAHYDLGNMLLRRGRAGEAIAEFEAALSADPGNETVRVNLAIALIQDGRGCEALQPLERATAASPGLLARPRVSEQIERLRRVCGPAPAPAPG